MEMRPLEELSRNAILGLLIFYYSRYKPYQQFMARPLSNKEHGRIMAKSYLVKSRWRDILSIHVSIIWMGWDSGFFNSDEYSDLLDLTRIGNWK